MKNLILLFILSSCATKENIVQGDYLFLYKNVNFLESSLEMTSYDLLTTEFKNLSESCYSIFKQDRFFFKMDVFKRNFNKVKEAIVLNSILRYNAVNNDFLIEEDVHFIKMECVDISRLFK